MSLPLYMDHNVVRAATEGCRQRGLDVLTAFEDRFHEQSDEDIQNRANSPGHAIFTQDTDFILLAANCQTHGVPFSGVIFGRPGGASIRQAIDDLDLICNTLSVEEMLNQLFWLPV